MVKISSLISNTIMPSNYSKNGYKFTWGTENNDNRSFYYKSG